MPGQSLPTEDRLFWLVSLNVADLSGKLPVSFLFSILNFASGVNRDVFFIGANEPAACRCSWACPCQFVSNFPNAFNLSKSTCTTPW